MQIDEAIRSRKSVRRFLPTPLGQDVVERILRLGARAPSGSNTQPWHVHVVTGAVRDGLCAEIYQAADEKAPNYEAEFSYYMQDWVEPYLSRRRSNGFGLYAKLGIAREDGAGRHRQMLRNFLFFGAPVGLFVCIDRRFHVGNFLDVGMFIQNLTLAARHEGLHTCVQQSFSIYHDIVRRHLPVKPEHIIVCALSLGHEDMSAPENSLETERAEVAAFSTFTGF